jgi:hypothetical protein
VGRSDCIPYTYQRNHVYHASTTSCRLFLMLSGSRSLFCIYLIDYTMRQCSRQDKLARTAPWSRHDLGTIRLSAHASLHCPQNTLKNNIARTIRYLFSRRHRLLIWVRSGYLQIIIERPRLAQGGRVTKEIQGKGESKNGEQQ